VDEVYYAIAKYRFSYDGAAVSLDPSKPVILQKFTFEVI
jgi:hypothetical protein